MHNLMECYVPIFIPFILLTEFILKNISLDRLSTNIERISMNSLDILSYCYDAIFKMVLHHGN